MDLVGITSQGGPSIFVLCWAVIKASTIEPDNLSVDGVSTPPPHLPSLSPTIPLF